MMVGTRTRADEDGDGRSSQRSFVPKKNKIVGGQVREMEWTSGVGVRHAWGEEERNIDS